MADETLSALKRCQERSRRQEELSLDRVRFFRFASHELKSPLVAIRTSLAALRDLAGDRLDPAMMELVTRSMARSEQMIGMVNDLLAMSIERSDVHDAWQPIDLAELLRDVIALQEPLARAKGMGFTSSGCEDRLMIQGNRFALEKAVGNLVGNGVRYTPAGGRVEVTLERSGGFAVLRVKDTGIGIPVEDQTRVFEAFHRARNARQAVPIGSGLGLALVKKAVEEHGGWVLLSSAEGEGTTFQVWLPERLDSAPAD